jgi:hypothetical protein
MSRSRWEDGWFRSVRALIRSKSNQEFVIYRLSKDWLLDGGRWRMSRKSHVEGADVGIRWQSDVDLMMKTMTRRVTTGAMIPLVRSGRL